MSDVLIYEVEEGIAKVAINRPEIMNALNMDLMKALIETGEAIKADKSVRAVVLYGNGKNFCGGLDMSIFAAGEFVQLPERTHGITNIYQQVCWVWHEVPVPVIAAVHGSCVGGGLQIICGADMRYIHPDTKMSIMEMKWGLIPDMAGTQLWKNFVREDVIRELTYTARIFTAKEGYDYGFVTKLTESPLEDAMETAKLITTKNPDAIRAAKRMINLQANAGDEEGLMTESVEQQAIIGKPNQMEAVKANFEKRPPQFQDPA
ncbi:MAG: crotonase/enoyl-CoA hydratase family protein [Pseudomonadales bacterium]|nr:crotonase/enoyl-CoA hydratase family protein [Pseudomonadales bacterium]